MLIWRWGQLGNRLNGQNTKIVSDLLTGVARLHAIDRQRRKRKNPYHRVE
ncbi:hypothetical protein [Arsenophonus nasoniae]|nr:hypothetical protein [Arsenophonus nasoniae]